jgi:hypothetical protein
MPSRVDTASPAKGNHMARLPPQLQHCNNPLITEQEVDRAQAALGVNLQLTFT